MDKRVNTAIIGCGRISVMHLECAKNSPKSNLVAVCDIDEEKAINTAKKYNARAYTDYKEMIEKESLDAVHICLPHYLHVPVAEYAFSKGINVLTEKPMSIDYESAKNCVKKAKEAGVLYGVIFQCRYNDSSVFLKKRIGAGNKLGKVISARSVLTWDRSKEYYACSDWKGTWDKEGGGVVIDQAIHSIDLVNWLINEDFKSISCSFANRMHPYLKVEDSAEGLVLYQSGARYGFYCMNNYGSDEPIEIRFLCENGAAILTYEDAKILYNDGTSEKLEKSSENVLYEGAKAYWGFSHSRQIEQFYKSCLGEEKLQISGEEALKTHKLLFEIYKQGKENLSRKTI